MTPKLKYICLIIGLMIFSRPAFAAPDAVLIERWTAHNPSSTEQIDHRQLDFLLNRYRSMGDDEIARFAYDKVTAADKTILKNYLKQLSQTKVSNLNRDAQYAFWVNLYNSLTLTVILDHYPVESIRDINISPGLFTSGPWGAKLIEIEGSPLSLDDIEHGIIRPIWKDPRSHYVLNCASLGCPDLPQKALNPDTLDQTLNQAAIAFINHPRAARVQGNDLQVSSIYRWFSVDFGTSDINIIAHLSLFARSGLKDALQAISDIDDDAYSWNLNQ